MRVDEPRSRPAKNAFRMIDLPVEMVQLTRILGTQRTDRAVGSIRSPVLTARSGSVAATNRHSIAKAFDSISKKIRPMAPTGLRSEEHTSELQSLMRISYAVFCLTKKKYSN